MPATMNSADVSLAGGISEAPRCARWPWSSKNCLKVSRISSDVIAIAGGVYADRVAAAVPTVRMARGVERDACGRPDGPDRVRRPALADGSDLLGARHLRRPHQDHLTDARRHTGRACGRGPALTRPAFGQPRPGRARVPAASRAR